VRLYICFALREAGFQPRFSLLLQGFGFALFVFHRGGFYISHIR